MLLQILIVALALGALGWFAYNRVGAQVFGLPVLIGLFALWALVKVFINSGLLGFAAVIIGVLVVWMVIGMAMTFGRDEYVAGDDDKPVDDF